jgi:hypothetical protein
MNCPGREAGSPGPRPLIPKACQNDRRRRGGWKPTEANQKAIVVHYDRVFTDPAPRAGEHCDQRCQLLGGFTGRYLLVCTTFVVTYHDPAVATLSCSLWTEHEDRLIIAEPGSWVTIGLPLRHGERREESVTETSAN